MQKKVLVILLTVLVFLSACVLGVTTVYRVDEVTLIVQAVSESEEAETEEKALRDSLLKVYKGDSILFAKKKNAQKTLESFPCFRLTNFEKKMPNQIIVKVTEDAEVYAVECAENGYYILSGDGMMLGERTDAKNRLDGENNLIMQGFTATGKRGQQLAGDDAFTSALAFCKELSTLLTGIRKNVLSVERVTMTPDGTAIPQTLLCFRMKEGVKLYVNQPEMLTKEKAAAGIETYLSLSIEQRTKGAITLLETATAVYEEIDSFEK